MKRRRAKARYAGSSSSLMFGGRRKQFASPEAHEERPEKVSAKEANEVNRARHPQDNPARATCRFACIGLVRWTRTTFSAELRSSEVDVRKVRGNEYPRNGEHPIFVARNCD